MKELNWILRHRRFMLFGALLYIICSLLACDNKAADPSRSPQENPISVESEQKDADTPDNNAQETDTITADELEVYREEIGSLSPNELIVKFAVDATEIEASAKAIAKHLAAHQQEEGKKKAVALQKKLRKNGILLNVIELRLLSGEFSQEQIDALQGSMSLMKESLKLSGKVNDIAIRMAE